MSDFKIDQKINAQPLAPAKAMDAEGGKDLPSRVKEEAEPSQTRDSKELEAKRNQQETTKPEELQQAVAKLNDYSQKMERKLDFQMDEGSGITVIKVYDSESDKLIRQIPNEEAVELAQKLNSEEPLFLFSARV